jgi:hypothetical protein
LLERHDLWAGRHTAELQAPELQSNLLLDEVDAPDLALLDAPDLFPDLAGPRKRLFDLRPACLGSGRDDPACAPDLLDGPDQRAPLRPFDHHNVRGGLTLYNLALVDPLKVGTVEVPVGHLELDTVLAQLTGDGLPVGQLPGHDLAVAKGHA